jgi:carboxyl-terminal processing protease
MKAFRVGLSAAVAALVFVGSLLPASLFAQAAGSQLSKESKDTVIGEMGRIIQNTAFVPGADFSKWDEFLAKNRESIEKAATESELADAINSDLSKFFGLSHIVLISPKAAQARMEKRAIGVGILVQQEDGGLRVVSVFPNTPAADAGLQSGDLIFEADGKKVTGVGSMLGEEGTTVEFKLKRDGAGVKNYKLVRRKYSNVRPETLTWLDADTAVLKVPTFDFGYDRSRVASLMSEAAKAKNLIVDLRSNGGGVVMNMLHFLGHFLPPDTAIGSFIDRSAVKRYVDETKGSSTDLRKIADYSTRGALKPMKVAEQPYKGHVAVLINGGSGSASEISAAAFKELLEAPVIGTRSAGAVLVSAMAPLSDGWFLQYPLMDYITALGVRLEGAGVEPDVKAETPRWKEADTGIEKAQALLNRMALREQRSGEKPPK